MIKRLIVIMFALAAHGVPASAASLSPFALDGAGRPVLEFYPATVVGFSAQGRDLMRLTVKETPGENDPRGPIDLELIVDCQSRQLAPSRIVSAAKDGASGRSAGPNRSSPTAEPYRSGSVLSDPVSTLFVCQGAQAESTWTCATATYDRSAQC